MLLLENNSLVKTIKFKNPKYIGDPINAVKIFNDLMADEIVLLDICASKEKRCLDSSLVRKIAEEANMPFSVGGGINKLSDIENLIKFGAERVVISSQAILKPSFVKEAVNEFGTSTISVCIDVKKNFWTGKQHIHAKNLSNYRKLEINDFVNLLQDYEVGELIIQSVDRDGMMNGFDIELLAGLSKITEVPIIGLGGGGDLNHFKELKNKSNVRGIASGSFFIFHDKNRGVLLSYPAQNELQLFK